MQDNPEKKAFESLLEVVYFWVYLVKEWFICIQFREFKHYKLVKIDFVMKLKL